MELETKVLDEAGIRALVASAIKSIGAPDHSSEVLLPSGRVSIDDPAWLTNKFAKLPALRNQEYWDRKDPQWKGQGIRLGQFLKCHALAALGSYATPLIAAEQLEKKGLIDPFVTKAIQAQTLTDGGSLMPPIFSDEWIPLLRANTVLREMGMKTVQMEATELIYSRQNAPATANYVGEVFSSPYSQAKTGNLKLSAKYLQAVTAISDQMLRLGGPAVDEFLRDDLALVMALRMDLAGLRGDATSETPMGLLYQVPASNIVSSSQAGSQATFQEISLLLAQAKLKIKEANVPLLNPGWVFHPIVEEYLYNVSSSLGVYPFRAEMDKGLLAKWPYKTTTQIPTTLGGSSNATEIYAAAFGHYLFGEAETLAVQAFPGGAYQDASGNVVSGVSNGTTPVRAQMWHDFQLRYTQAAAMITGVQWYGNWT